MKIGQFNWIVNFDSGTTGEVLREVIFRATGYEHPKSEEENETHS
jgi:hypothetical protein